MERQPNSAEGQSPALEGRRGAAGRCYWHPEAETGLSCIRCAKGVCPQCMVQAPVGQLCRECGKAARMPTYEIGPAYMARALATAGGVALVGGVLWWVLNVSILGRIPFVSALFAVAVGYAAGELVSRATNRKRGAQLAWITGGAVVVAFLVSSVFQPFVFDPWGLLVIVVGVFVAVQRVR